MTSSNRLPHHLRRNVTAVSVLANPITWTINVTLDDDATVTGFFVFDPDIAARQLLTNYSINISAATPGTLRGVSNNNLPTSVFFPFDFTPADSGAGGGPDSKVAVGQSFVFSSITLPKSNTKLTR